ncbi:MAG: hypothetical protein BWY95_02192 [Bacteroidetes bacterium ADurb.BinA104]|nr:MAG: hypothetical protein BWY95_02192 [Bacteroidetes bacterium ADurb.BinA104]
MIETTQLTYFRINREMTDNIIEMNQVLTKPIIQGIRFDYVNQKIFA